MKKIYLTIVLSVILGASNFYKAQSEIWGMNSSGGNGLGTIYGLPTGNTAITTQYSLTGNPGSNPQYIKLAEAPNGKLYGMTNTGGGNNQGIIFEYDTLTGVYVRKMDFIGTNGANPKGSLKLAANGKFYGMTQLGGTNNLGVLFEYNASTNSYSVLLNFTGMAGSFPGSQPMGALTQPNPANPRLFGMTRTGGTNDRGVIFEYNYSLNTYTTYVNFDGNTGLALGGNPQGQLTALSPTNTVLYGLASLGGTNNIGTLFEFDYGSGIITKKFDFLSSTGSTPLGSLMLSANGRLYGTASTAGGSTGGVIFEYLPGLGTYNKLQDLTNGAGSLGGGPQGDLLEATNGMLYGVTRVGGAGNVGALFELDITVPATPVYTKKYDFVTANGSLPLSSLVQVSTGKLYGATSAGGAVAGGVIFQFTMGGTFTKKVDLNLSTGGNPNGHLITASNGKMYGLASIGGTFNALGVLFEYDKMLNSYTPKINFTGNAGANPGSLPLGSLLQATNGKLYGLTSAGGSGGLGTIFSYDIISGVHTVHTNFTGPAGANPGSVPYGSLAQFTGTGTANGKIYGMTKQGGGTAPTQGGVIFEFDPGLNVYTRKRDLTTLLAVDGYSAFGSLTETNNKFYGMTQLGGAGGMGVIFEYDPNANTYTKKIDFTGTAGLAPGSLPFGSLVQTATVGILYGMTKTGGANDLGVIFEYNALNNTYSKKYDMTLADGSNPLGSLIRAANDKLYGVTNSGGANSSGVLFEFDVALSAYTKKLDFSGTTGNYPMYTQLLEVCTKPLNAGAISSSTAAICAADLTSQTFSISPVSNATSYTWTIPAGASITSGSTIAAINVNLSGLAAGTYTYGVTGVNICGTGTLQSVANITVNAVPTVSVNSGTICGGQIFTIVPTGASTYSVQGGSTSVSPPPGNTTYTVIGVSAEGCVSSNVAVSSLTVFTPPTIGVSDGTICSGAQFTLVPTGVITSTPSGGSLVVSPATSTFYTITGTDANNCISANTATAFITVNTTPVISVSSTTMCAGTNATINPSGAGAGGTYTVNGTPGAGPFVVSPGSTTNYTVAGTTALNCVSSNTPAISVTVFTLPVIGVSNGTICSGGQFTIVPTGVVTSTPSGGSLVVAPTSNTFYTVTGSDANNCVSANTATAFITVNTTPVISVSSTTMCAGSNATINPAGAGAGGTYTVNGTPGAGPFIVSPGSTTNYTVAGTTSLNCVSSNTPGLTVTVYTLPIIGVSNGTICSGQQFTIVPTGVVTSTPSGGSLVVAPTSNTFYTITGSDINNCVSANTATAFITVNTTPLVSAANVTMCAGKNATISPSGAGAGATYTLNGTPGAGPFVVSPGSTTTFTLAGTTSLNCVSSNTPNVSVTVYTLPVIGVTNSTMCATKNATLTVNGAGVNGTYTLNGTPGAGPSFVVSPGSTSNFTVAGTSSLGCLSSNTATSTVTVYTLPVISVNSGSVCSGTSFVFTPTGSVTYTMTGPVAGTSFTVQPGVSTSYTFAGTSADGCVSAAPATGNLTVHARPTLSVNSGSVCFGNNFTITPQGGASYTILPMGNVTTTSLVIAAPATPNNTYVIIGLSAQGCSGLNTPASNLTVHPVPSVTAVSGAICIGQVFTTTVFGAVSYTYAPVTPGQTVVSSGSTTFSPSSSEAYTVTGASNMGCLGFTNMTITVNSLPTVAITGTNAICDGETTTLTASGANTYNWGISTNTAISVNPNITTTYIVTGTDVNNCTDQETFTLTVNQLPTVTVVSGAICPGNCYTLSPSGAANYTFFPNGAVVCPSVTTNYSVTGSSTAGCISAAPGLATVSVVNILTVTVSGNTTICNGGTVNLTANGASTYSWNTGALTNTLSETPTANKTYTVIGFSGTCSDTTDIMVTVNQLPNVTATPQRSVICVNESVEIYSGGAVSYSWLPTGSGTVITVSPTALTGYTVTGLDANGCVNSATTSVEVGPCSGIAENLAGLSGFGVYPNPNSGEFVIDTPVKMDVTIVNALGQVIVKIALEEGKNQVDLNTQAKGVYFVQFKNGSILKTVKIVKQ